LKPLFAYFTDVHGNIDALQAVVEDAAALGANRFICGGDMIGIGPFTNEVVKLLISLPSIQMVTGNHDEAVLALKSGQPYPKSHMHAKAHHQWVADHLLETYASKLSKLPRELDFYESGFRFLVTHYSYKQGKKESPIAEDPFMPIINEPEQASMAELFGYPVPYQFVGFGHHHLVHDFILDDTYFVNPGALGCNIKAEARYALVYGKDQGLQVVFKSVPYDRTRLITAYKELQVPEGPFLMKAFHGIGY
jgi:predicted phosphodiesterase